jgi:hypothetical protein
LAGLNQLTRMNERGENGSSNGIRYLTFSETLRYLRNARLARRYFARD